MKLPHSPQRYHHLDISLDVLTSKHDGPASQAIQTDCPYHYFLIMDNDTIWSWSKVYRYRHHSNEGWRKSYVIRTQFCSYFLVAPALLRSEAVKFQWKYVVQRVDWRRCGVIHKARGGPFLHPRRRCCVDDDPCHRRSWRRGGGRPRRCRRIRRRCISL